MDAFKAYKYYLALKLHFTTPSYNVFTHKGHVKGARDKFESRNDAKLFVGLARQYPNDKECIQFMAANFMYKNHTFLYSDPTRARDLYQEFMKRKQSITKVFSDDLQTLLDKNIDYTLGGSKIPDVVRLYMGGFITLETMVILDTFDGIVDWIKTNAQLSLIIGSDILLIEKSKGFIKFDPYRVMVPYNQFKEDIEEAIHG